MDISPTPGTRVQPRPRISGDELAGLCAEGVDQVLNGVERMGGAEFVDMGQHGADALGLGFESVKPQ